MTIISTTEADSLYNDLEKKSITGAPAQHPRGRQESFACRARCNSANRETRRRNLSAHEKRGPVVFTWVPEPVDVWAFWMLRKFRQLLGLGPTWLSDSLPAATALFVKPLKWPKTTKSRPGKTSKNTS